MFVCARMRKERYTAKTDTQVDRYKTNTFADKIANIKNKTVRYKERERKKVCVCVNFHVNYEILIFQHLFLYCVVDLL